MWLECLLLVLLVETTTQTFCEPIEYYDPFPNCSECPSVLGDTRQGIGSIINGLDTAIHLFCHLRPSKEEARMATKDLITKTLEETKNAFFPKQYAKNVSRTVACGHFYKICPDVSKDGKPLKEQEWSCQACTSLLDSLFDVIRTPINDINALASDFFVRKEMKVA